MATKPCFYSLKIIRFFNEFLIHKYYNMFPLPNSFQIFLSNFIASLSVFGAVIIHFSRHVPFIHRSLFNSRSNPTIDSDFGTKPISVDSVLASNSSKFQLEPTKQICGFVEESGTATSVVEELYCDSSPSSGNNQFPDDFDFSCGKNSWEFGLGTGEGFVEVFDDEQKKKGLESRDFEISSGKNLWEFGLETGESFVEGFRDEQKKGLESSDLGLLPEALTLGEDCSDSECLGFVEEFKDEQKKNLDSCDFGLSHEVLTLGEDCSVSLSDSESLSFVEELKDQQIKGLESSDFGLLPEALTLEEDCSVSISDSESESLSFDEEFIELELEPQLLVSNAKILPVNEDGFGESKETDWDNKEMGFEEEKEEEDFLEEHQDLINQLKMELRNSRTGGLPTVLEEVGEPESICPTSVEALKPRKNGGGFEQKEHYKEILKVYKTYADRMRKLDIFNTQTNYAIGFVKLKDPTSSIDGSKPGIKSLLSHKLRPGKALKSCPKLIRDLKRDMEMVYVGHICLSWEVLNWQHRKAIQLQQNASRRTSQYSRVASEFQLFCILIQRFIEDERFCGPRIENYVKNRLLVRSLLQVPAIREDCDKEGETTISTAALVSIIEEAMHVFREFLQTDKDVGNSGIKRTQVQLHHTDHIQTPFDAQLMMMEVRTELRKKEKRLKDIVRSGNCIVKKLQRISEEGRVKKELLIAEVELKLISRVMSMSRLTESQLIWCHKKLHQVNFVDRKVLVEPSFLLFPC